MLLHREPLGQTAALLRTPESSGQGLPLVTHDNIVFLQLRDTVLRAAARLNLPINWIPERLSEQNFNLEEPPTKSSPWVAVLLNHLRVFRQRLETAGGMSPEDVEQVQCI